MRARRDWYKSFFRNTFYNPASPQAVAKAPGEAAFIARQLRLKKNARLLDLCCGPGRHAVEFARRGLDVTGYDLSAEYLREAAARAKKARVKLRLLRGDMRRLKFREDFDAAVNLFTSFGYFLEESDDIRTLKGAAAALKPGGLLVVDVVNGDFIRKNFLPRRWQELDDHYLLDSTELTADGIHTEWVRIRKSDGRTAGRTFFTRLYGKRRLSAALRKAGLEPLKFWGSFSGEKLTAARDRLICLARKY